MPKSGKNISTETAPISFQDDVVTILENEFEQVRSCIGMYIGSGETEGVLHIINEIVTNSIDEATNDECVKAGIGNLIEVFFDETTTEITIRDNGRGIPLDQLLTMVGHKHASTKIGRLSNRYSGGQNGVGMTVTAALSKVFKMRCYRHGKTRSVHIDGNELIDDGIKACSPDKHGSSVSFAPDRRYIGNFNVECSDIEDYLRRLSYIIPQRVKIKYIGTNTKGHSTAITYKSQGISANVEYLSNSLEFAPIRLVIPEVEVEFPDRDSDFFKMDIAFSFDRTLDDTVSASFCNWIATKDGGYHESAVIRSLSEFFVKTAKDADPNHKYEVIGDDCRRGLIFAVNCDHSDPKFEGQHKSRVGQKDLPRCARKYILEALRDNFANNNAQLARIVTYLRQVARTRIESLKIKKTVLKKPSTFIDDAAMRIFSNISQRDYSGYKEIILAEGDSAISAVGSARNVQCQAVFAITGVVANTFGMSTAKVIQTSPTFASLVKVLGCGIGADFDITKLKWNAIIIATDKDVDGDNITSLLSTFFACHLPGIVTAGRLYKVIPPLYRIDTKPLKKIYNGRDYLFDKSEYYSLYAKIVSDNLDIAITYPENETDYINGSGNFEILSKKEKYKFITENMNYLVELRYLQDRSYCNMTILEALCHFMATSGDVTTMARRLNAKFPEIHHDPVLESIYGSYNRQSIALIIDTIFFKMAKRMMRLMTNSPLHVLCKGKNDTRGDDPRANNWDLMTLGEFMAMAEKTFAIEILQRYKGLGESDADMIFPSMMNPKTRKLIRISMDDPKRTIDNMRILHGDGVDMREARRQLLASADITQSDIDN